MTKVKIAILASGSGSNAESILKWAANSDVAEVVCVLSDKRKALVLERAKNNNVPALAVSKKKNEDRTYFEQRMIANLEGYRPDWIVLAGFMKLLGPHFLKAYDKKIINIHPSLLPLFPGIDGYGDAYRANVAESGCTIHYVNAGMDTGEIIAQKKFALISGESFEELKERGLAIENKFYPEVLEKLFKDML
ncbi:MAG: phosphoribosylglycinamide formyltransferase [Bacteriovorax sp.]|nr:phosphoribosylglycinamide formyltransferase [Bacteriovorax sp.]